MAFFALGRARLTQRLFAVSALLFAFGLLPGCAPRVTTEKSTALPTPPPYTEPPIVRSDSNRVAGFFLSAIDNDEGVPAFEYQGPYVAPTIEVNPGDEIQVTYRNLLVRKGAPLAHGHPDRTNLHFHGLTTSPLPPEDDAIDTIGRFQMTDYIVEINANQPPGLYWYHPHPHGESAWQVGNGMSGALIVEGIEKEVPDVAGLRERLLIVRQPFSADEDAERNAAGHNFCGLKRLTPAQRAAFLKRLGRAPSPKPTDSTALTINGLKAGAVTIGIKPGERELFRVLNATSGRYLTLSIPGQKLELVAEDGVPLAEYPGSPRTLEQAQVIVPPAGRAEFVVTGSEGPTTLRTSSFDTGPNGDPNPASVLATLQDDGGGTSRDPRLPQHRTAAHAVPASSFYRRPLGEPAVSRVVRLQETPDGTQFAINGASYEPTDAPMFTAKVGTVERWTLVNPTNEVHDFHIHQVHFVVESVDGVPVPASERHWHDEVSVPYQHKHADGSKTPGKAVILVDFRDPVIRGTFLFHCHILDHEDGGMMAKIRVI
jgi:FtsP/CotA-like multicopper oxidase with cupredoxin domain